MPNIIPKVPKQNPNQSQLWLPRVTNPYLGVWWTSQTVTNVPENVMGWLVAQGFEVTNISQDQTTVPPTNYFSVTKQGLRPQQVLLSLCNSYTIAANDARTANQVRYNQILSNMTDMIDSSHDQFNAQVDEQNLQAGVYLADLDQYMTAVETMIYENQAQVVVDAQAAKVALGEMMVRLGDLETNATNNANRIGALFVEQDANLSLYVTEYDTKLAEIDQNFAAYLADILSQIALIGTVTETHIATYNQRFAELANDYNAYSTDINARMANVGSNVNEHVSDINLILDRMYVDYQEVALKLEAFKAEAGSLAEDHEDDIEGIIDGMYNVQSSNAVATRGLLENLGGTELARINEQFASNLSVQMQQLVSRGLSSSIIPVDITARNHRDRDEQIQLLNDRLNREKVENEHRLYEQRANVLLQDLQGTERLHAVRQEVLRYQATVVSNVYSLLKEVDNRVIAGKDALFAARDANFKYGIEVSSNLYLRLQELRQRTIDSLDRIYQLRDIFSKWKADETKRQYEQIQQIESQFLECIQRKYTNRQDVSKTEMSQRDTLLSQLQSALTSLMSGKERYAVLLMQNANSLADHKHRAIIELMNTSIQRLEGWKSIADQNRTLMAYQLDERNKLLIGLYSFVERREDVAPEWKDMSAMIAGLADSGGGWLSPN